MERCPSLENLTFLISGNAEVACLERLVAHVGVCGVCQTVLEKLAIGQHAGSTEQAASTQLTPTDTALLGRVRKKLISITRPQQELPSIPGFESEQLIGAGGQATVVRARQARLGGRVVALKLMGRQGGMVARQDFTRFRTEAEAFARLEHDNVVRIYEVGEYSSQPYLVLEYIDGGTLQDKLGDKPLPPLKAAVLLETLALAVQYMHERGVVHRDLKPRNVLLTKAGVAKIGDFGLARFAEMDSDFTRTEQLLGTREYMSPEQARGQNKAVGPHSDIYALGVILFKALTGRTPFVERAGDQLELLRQICEEDPLSPRQLQPAVPQELGTICLKCLSKSPRDRYLTAGELADDIRRYLEHRPILAQPGSTAQLLVKWCRRHPARVAVVSISLFAVVFILSFALLAATRERHLRLQAYDANRQLEQTLYVNRLALAERYLAIGLPNVASSHLDLCRPDLRGWEWNCLRRMSLPSPHRVVALGFVSIRGIAVSPDQKQALVAGKGPGLLLLNLPEESVETLDGFQGQASSVAFSPDGRWMAAGGSDHMVYLWDRSSRTLVRKFTGHEGSVLTIAFCPDGKRLASAGHDNTVRIFDVENKLEPVLLLGHKESVKGVAFHPRGHWLASASSDQNVLIWNLETNGTVTESPIVKAFGSEVLSVCFSPDGKTLVAGGEDRLIHQWNCDDWRELPSLEGHRGAVWSVAFQTATEVVSAGGDTTIRVHDSKTRNQLAVLYGNTKDAKCVSATSDGSHFVSGGSDGTVRLWPWPHQGSIQVLRGHLNAVLGVACSANGRTLATFSRDKTARKWDANAGKIVWEFSAGEEDLIHIAIHPSKEFVALLFANSTARVLDASTGTLIGPSMQLTGRPRSCCFSPNGQWLLTAAASNKETDDCEVWAWPVPSFSDSKKLPGPFGAVRDMSFNPTGNQLAVASGNTTVLFDWPQGTRLATLPAGQANLSCIQFHPIRPELFAGDTDGLLWVWNSRTHELSQQFRAHASSIADFVCHPYEPRLFTVGFDATIKVWRWPEAQEIVSLTGHNNFVFSLAISPDGKRLFSASADGTARVWDGTPWDPE